MHTLRVWAPEPMDVEVELDTGRLPMRAEGDGWWSLCSPQLSAGVDYAFCLDGGDPRPDPRSPWQPRGVHGPSRMIDHEAFGWTDQGWRAGPLASALLYEVHVGTFTPEGTFDGVIERLDHLVDLGVTHLQLMPVAASPGERGWGYDGVDLYAPQQSYGGPQGLKRLVDACHARGLAVLLDVVYNHLGPSGNYLHEFGPYFTDRYETPWGQAFNLDGPGSHEVRRYLCDNALMWFRDYHIDGLRLDAIHAIHDTSAIHFLEQLSTQVARLERQLGRGLDLIAESDLNDPRVIRPVEVGGYGIDAQWSDDFHHALHGALTGEHRGYYADFSGIEDLAAALERGFVYDGRYSAYRRRHHGRPATGVGGHQLLGYMQNHDQVGNRAVGERIGHLVSPREVEIGAALVLLGPFVPMLFQGEEWGVSAPFQYFTDHQEPELAEAVRQGRQREFASFGWDPEQVPDPQDRQTWARSVLDWGELEDDGHAELLDWYRRLIALRQERPELIDGDLGRVQVRWDEAQRWLIMERGAIVVACNLADEPRRLPLSGARAARCLLANEGAVEEAAEEELALAACSVAVLER